MAVFDNDDSGRRLPWRGGMEPNSSDGVCYQISLAELFGELIYPADTEISTSKLVDNPPRHKENLLIRKCHFLISISTFLSQ